MKKLRFATDLVTFYDPAYWGGSGAMSDLRDLVGPGKAWEPLSFWERVLDATREAGLDGIEITFAPGNWQSALTAYGSASGFAAAVHDRGLQVCSGFLSTRLPNGRELDIADTADHSAIFELVSGYAEFLKNCGADVMVASLPLRKSRDAEPPLFVDRQQAETIAGALNRMGYDCIRRGVRLALHPEAFSFLRNSRDVDLFMLLTDPTYVFLCPDTAQFTVAGSDPLDVVRRHRDRLIITHWKDAVGAAPADTAIDERIYDRQTQWFAPIGNGIVDWPGWLRLLRELRYSGWAIFELDAAHDPVADLRRMKRYVDQSLLQIYQ
ncbi:MAG TPA: sugar phosphate isomerase/epimerase [Roseiflexaceae bacterium]|nr:sugar phosphate isomerase/epimerase [Roseiflexaceae bacterium]